MLLVEGKKYIIVGFTVGYHRSGNIFIFKTRYFFGSSSKLQYFKSFKRDKK